METKQVLEMMARMLQQQKEEQRQLEEQRQQRQAQQEQHAALIQLISTIATPAAQQQQQRPLPPFPSFEEAKEKWSSYAARLRQHLAYYQVSEDASRRAFFLSISNSQVYELIQTLHPNEIVENVTFKEIMEKLDKYYNLML